MKKRPYVGETGFTEQIGIPYTIRAEATHWDVMDVLVQMRDFRDGSYQVVETDKDGIRVKECYIGPDEEEAYRTWLNGAFGA